VLKRQHSKHFEWKDEISPDASGIVSVRIREGPMGFILGFFAAALLAGTGIYNPKLMHNGRCMAEPGGIYALYYCVPETAAPRRNSAR
jgi:hypothetical protein